MLFTAVGLLSAGASAFTLGVHPGVASARTNAPAMVDLANGKMSFDRVCREWRCKYEGDKVTSASLEAIAGVVDEYLPALKALSPEVKVNRLVCGGCLDFKLQTTVPLDAFGPWEEKANEALIWDMWGKRGATYGEKGVCRRIETSAECLGHTNTPTLNPILHLNPYPTPTQSLPNPSYSRRPTRRILTPPYPPTHAALARPRLPPPHPPSPPPDTPPTNAKKHFLCIFPNFAPPLLPYVQYLILRASRRRRSSSPSSTRSTASLWLRRKPSPTWSSRELNRLY